MSQLDTLNILIGLVTIYLIFSMACTSCVEAITSMMGKRSTNLEDALKEFLSGEINEGDVSKPFVDAFYAHPLIQSLSLGKAGRPSYIPQELVADVIVSLLTRDMTDKPVLLADGVKELPSEPSSAGVKCTNRIKGIFKTFLARIDSVADEAKKLEEFKKYVGAHFDATMDRASGWFKRHTQLVSFLVSAVLVVTFNVDTITLMKFLATTPAAQAAMLNTAKDIVSKNTQGNAESKSVVPTSIANQENNKASAVLLQQAPEEAWKGVNNLLSGLPLGWKGYFFVSCGSIHRDDIGFFLEKFFGLLISVFAISLGAPFWFDTLQRFMQIRSSGISPKENNEKKQAAAVERIKGAVLAKYQTPHVL